MSMRRSVVLPVAFAISGAYGMSAGSVSTGKDALALITKEGFGDQRLGVIKQAYLSGKDVGNTVEFGGKSYGFAPNTYIVEASARSLTVMYSLTGTNYGILDGAVKARLIEEQRADGVYSEHFDVTLMDVAQRARAIGLEDKISIANKVGELKWSWNEAGYKCTLYASINAYMGENKMSYICTYNR